MQMDLHAVMSRYKLGYDTSELVVSAMCWEVGLSKLVQTWSIWPPLVIVNKVSVRTLAPGRGCYLINNLSPVHAKEYATWSLGQNLGFHYPLLRCWQNAMSKSDLGTLCCINRSDHRLLDLGHTQGPVIKTGRYDYRMEVRHTRLKTQKHQMSESDHISRNIRKLLDVKVK